MFVVDETNIETHGMALSGTMDVLHCDRARWGSAILSRAHACFARTKNHCCVIGYSLGNEAGFGPNLFANYRFFLEQTTFLHLHACERRSGMNADEHHML
ncbi:unnamed protein product, partial [Amoebophrya sp. A120]